MTSIIATIATIRVWYDQLFPCSCQSSISRIVKQINKVEIDNGKLRLELQTLSDLSEGAIEMYNDSNFIYNYKYYENVVFFLIISGLGYTFYKSMTKGNIPN